jgi:hypothetical protein
MRYVYLVYRDWDIYNAMSASECKSSLMNISPMTTGSRAPDGNKMRWDQGLTSDTQVTGERQQP